MGVGIAPGMDLSGLGVQVQPGLSTLTDIINAAVQKYIADINAANDKAQIEQQRQLQEAQLAASPGDFVAYELYKRALQGAGVKPTTGPVRSDQEIQSAFTQALGFTPQSPQSQYETPQPFRGGQTPNAIDALLAMRQGNNALGQYYLRVKAGLETYDQAKAESLGAPVPSAPPAIAGTGARSMGGGIGAFGVTIPRTGEFSRSQFQNYSPSELATLGSFLKGGTQVGGQSVGIDPSDYFKQVQQGFIPTFNYSGPTQVKV